MILQIRITIQHRAGDDAYTFGRGDGQDTVLDLGGNDVLKLGEGISLSDLNFQSSASNLVIGLKDSTDKITISNWFEASGDKKIEKIQFSNEAYITSAQIDSLFQGQPAPTPDNIIYGTDGDDYMVGNYESNIYYLGKGNDTIKDLNGSDTYIFSRGDGHDVLDDSTGLDILKLGEGITANDIEFWTNPTKTDLKIQLKNSNDSLTIPNGLILGSKIELFEFADGTIKTILDLQNSVNFNIIGTDNNDNFEGPNTDTTYNMGKGDDYINDRGGNDTYVMGEGADRIYDWRGNDIYNMGIGNDDISDQGGNDTYIFNRGDGQDVINDGDSGYQSQDINTIKFGTGITKDDLIFRNIPSGIEISIKDTTDKITWQSTTLNMIEFNDGSYLNRDEILSNIALITGTPNADNISNGFPKETFAKK